MPAQQVVPFDDVKVLKQKESAYESEREDEVEAGAGHLFAARDQRSNCCRFMPMPINPENSAFLRRWDMVTALFLMIVCFMSPFEVAFLNVEHGLEWVRNGADSLFWFNRIIDGVFIVDITLQFFIMYPVQRQWGLIYVTAHGRIVQNYLRTWFIVDFVSILPFDILGIILKSGSVRQLKMLRVVRLLRLLKLARLLRGLRIFKRWEVEISVNYRTLTLYQLLFAVILAAHLTACALGIIINQQSNVCEGGGSEDADCQMTWWSPMARQLSEQGEKVTPFKVYTIALYVSATIIVHPHVLPPQSAGETLPFVLLVFFGGFLWTRVISRTTTLMTSMDRHTIFHRQSMDDLNTITHDLGLPHTLRRRLRLYFINTKKHLQKDTWLQLQDRMSPALRIEVSYQSCKHWVRSLPYFKNVSKLFLQDITSNMKTQHFAQGETFGDNFVLYILKNGLLSWSKGIGQIKILRSGCVWGHEHLFLNNPDLLQPNTATTMVFTEVLSIDRKTFKQVCEEYPEYQPSFHQVYLKYTFTRTVFYVVQLEKKKMASLNRQKNSKAGQDIVQRRFGGPSR